MHTCTLCQKNFKTSQGLAGHNYFVHSDHSISRKIPAAQLTEQYSGRRPAAPAADEPWLSRLEYRLEMLEQATGIKAEQPDNEYHFGTEPLIEQVAQLAQQLKTLTSSCVSQAELTPVCNRLEGLSGQMTSLDFRCHSLFDELSTLEKELGEKADQGTAISIEARIARLERAQTEIVKLTKAIADSQTQSIQNINSIISKLTERLNFIFNQVGEQKGLTDWVKKKFELVPVEA